MQDVTAIDNPMGTDGFEFVEYTAPDPKLLGALFEHLGFDPVARHRSKDVLLYRQGRINFIVNREPDSFAQSFARVHGPSACAFAMRVKDAAKAYKRALELGARFSLGSDAHPRQRCGDLAYSRQMVERCHIPLDRLLRPGDVRRAADAEAAAG